MIVKRSRGALTNLRLVILSRRVIRDLHARLETQRPQVPGVLDSPGVALWFRLVAGRSRGRGGALKQRHLGFSLLRLIRARENQRNPPKRQVILGRKAQRNDGVGRYKTVARGLIHIDRRRKIVNDANLVANLLATREPFWIFQLKPVGAGLLQDPGSGAGDGQIESVAVRG